LTPSETDANGSFAIRNVAPGEYTLCVTKPGFFEEASEATRPLVVTAAGIRIERELIPYGSIAGRVVSPKGVPVAGAVVRAGRLMASAGSDRIVLSARAITANDGSYRLEEIPPGRYTVVIPSAVVSTPATLDRSVLGPQSRMRRHLNRVLSPFGQAAESLKIATVGDDAFTYSGAGLAAMAASSGPHEAMFSQVHNGLHSMVQQFRSVGPGEQVVGSDIQLAVSRVVRATGVVINEAGQPSSGAVVELTPQPSGGPGLPLPVAVALTDANGRFAVPAVAGEPYSVRVVQLSDESPAGQRSDRFGSASFNGIVGAADVWTLRIAPAAVVNMSLTWNGAMAVPTELQNPRVSVRLERLDNLPPGEAVRGDAQGGLSIGFAALEPGRYVLQPLILPPGWRIASVAHRQRPVTGLAFDLNEGPNDLTVALTSEAARIAGVVTYQEQQSRRTVPTTVLLFSANASLWHGQGTRNDWVRRVQATDDGTFALSGVQPGAYYLIAVPTRELRDWWTVGMLERLQPVAERISLAVGAQSVSIPLRSTGGGRLP
jgi:hypothetical protein